MKKLNKTQLKKEAWTHKTESYWYEYHLESEGFFTEVHAGSSSQARIKGWEAFLRTRRGSEYRN